MNCHVDAKIQTHDEQSVLLTAEPSPGSRKYSFMAIPYETFAFWEVK